jgi:hypothetical protein
VPGFPVTDVPGLTSQDLPIPKALPEGADWAKEINNRLKSQLMGWLKSLVTWILQAWAG